MAGYRHGGSHRGTLPTRYGRIPFDSWLERDVMRWLEAQGYAWNRPEHQFALPGGTWTPDLNVMVGGHQWLIEVKPDWSKAMAWVDKMVEAALPIPDVVTIGLIVQVGPFPKVYEQLAGFEVAAVARDGSIGPRMLLNPPQEA